MGFGDIFKIKQFKSEIERLTAENQALFSDNSSMHQKMSELGIYDYLKFKSNARETWCVILVSVS